MLADTIPIIFTLTMEMSFKNYHARLNMLESSLHCILNGYTQKSDPSSLIFLILLFCRYCIEAPERNSAYLTKKEIREVFGCDLLYLPLIFLDYNIQNYLNMLSPQSPLSHTPGSVLAPDWRNLKFPAPL